MMLILFLLFLTAAAEGGEDDLVAKIPGIIFEPNFKTYSGYLYGNEQKTWKLHYMLTTSRSNKTTDPVVFWFNVLSGCSSFTGSFQELGPLYVDVDGKQIFENVYSWNRNAHLVYLESPVGVGFSYDTTNVHYKQASDNQTMDQNFAAINDFFSRVQTQFATNDFYLAGIYIPTLAAKLARNLQSFSNKNFRGVLIGNGFMHVKSLMNTLILWSYYHGQIGGDEWTVLKKECCQKPQDGDTDDCDWMSWLKTSNGLDYRADEATKCGKIINRIINADSAIDPYNFYEDCYAEKKNASLYRQSERAQKNPAAFFNRQSTDGLSGYPCVSGSNALTYFNRTDFIDAFHIDKTFYSAGGYFDDCSDEVYNNYAVQYNDTSSLFDVILDTLSNFKILIVNGDVDTVCNFLGDARFIQMIADKRKISSTPRTTWYFRNRVGGYVQRYKDEKNSVIDVLTVKGAGHMHMLDRPGPALQMFERFLSGANNYGEANSTDPGVPLALPLVGNSAIKLTASLFLTLFLLFQ
ncbi:hypothetical protein M3Y94_00005400 [Aphelenchoides besseyi]|nr:hypothetical protein M3Y94_00005400 [Aphelenchoides besseyi]